MDNPLELIISMFDTPAQADRALKNLKSATNKDLFQIKDAAVIEKDADGHVHLDDDQDVSAGEGTLFGAVTGALVGLLGGPVGAVVGAVAGTATGGVSAALLDMGFSNDDLQELQASLPNNSSALVLLVEHTWVEPLVRQLETQKGRLYRNELNPKVVGQYR